MHSQISSAILVFVLRMWYIFKTIIIVHVHINIKNHHDRCWFISMKCFANSNIIKNNVKKIITDFYIYTFLSEFLTQYGLIPNVPNYCVINVDNYYVSLLFHTQNKFYVIILFTCCSVIDPRLCHPDLIVFCVFCKKILM